MVSGVIEEAEKILNDEVQASELVEKCLERIKEVENELNAFITINSVGVYLKSDGRYTFLKFFIKLIIIFYFRTSEASSRR